MEASDQGAATTSQVGDNVVVESGVPYSSHSPPLVQQPSWGDSSFHSPVEGSVDDTALLDFGPNASFWETPVGQAIASFGTRGISSKIEEERRQYCSAILRAKEIDKQIDDILGPTLPRSTSVPRGYRSLAESMRPIEPIVDRPLTPHNPSQDTTPTTSHVMSIPNLPRSFVPEIQPSILVLSTPSSAWGQPLARTTLFDTGIVTS